MKVDFRIPCTIVPDMQLNLFCWLGAGYISRACLGSPLLQNDLLFVELKDILHDEEIKRSLIELEAMSAVHPGQKRLPFGMRVFTQIVCVLICHLHQQSDLR